MEQQIIVKTEIQNNGEILLYYVDENGESQQGVVTTLEDVENSGIQLQENYILDNLEEYVDDVPLEAEVEEPSDPLKHWSDEDTRRLLIFYNDNKHSFVSGVTQKKHLWAVACKTMLIGKDMDNCETKLTELKSKYREVRNYTEKGLYVKWPFLDMCHQAFHDDAESASHEISKPKIEVLQQDVISKNGTIFKQIENPVVKQIQTKNADEKVEKMLNLYLKYKEKFQLEHWRRDLWDTIAAEIGTTDNGDYWHKRFLNFKQHYITMLTKQKDNLGPITWPYMDLFDKIFKDDVNFHKKYFNTTPESVVTRPKIEMEVPAAADTEEEWTTPHITVLGKYYFDSYEEFEDPTIPDAFLWTEIGRLLDKKPERCKEKYAELREGHLLNYIAGGYDLENRSAIAIILDYIIAKDVKKELIDKRNTADALETWKTEQVDELVQFFYDNISVFKDQICYFVCWEAVAKKLKRDIESCKHQWEELVSLYSSILQDKKDDPEVQIDWRYIELFDGIFDYGMDVDFIKGYSNEILQNASGKVGVKKVIINADSGTRALNQKDTEDQVGASPRTDPRSTKILEFYLKNKDKFQQSHNKLTSWAPLAAEINIDTTQCAQRFRHLKKSYIDNVRKEIENPKTNISWPYYALCKKVFGYRTIKNKLKQGEGADEDWLPKDIKQLITFFSKNFHYITDNIADGSKWLPIANELGKSKAACRDKFLELRKCYRKLKTMVTRNPDVKISWSYFTMFDWIYNQNEGSEEKVTEDSMEMEVETLEEDHLDMDELGDDDYECIIVLQEGQDLSDLENGHIIIQDPSVQTENEQDAQALETFERTKPTNVWTKRTKKRLLIHYINYMRSHRGKKINYKQLWKEIATKMLNKTNIQCKKMFNRIKNAYNNADEEKQRSCPLHSLMEKVLKLKPKTISPINDAKTQKQYKDVEMDPMKVQSALTYYLSHIDDFLNPQFEKKYLWTELAKHISEPVTKVCNKVNYLKQAYNVETEEIDGDKTPFSNILNEIIVKEVSMNALLDEGVKTFFNDDEVSWAEYETESLLRWYLSNLDKFKNPKFNRSYLWMEASSILNKSPVVCSKKMSEIRTQYRNMVKNDAIELREWRFLELCQKIYGTGKKSSETDSN